MSNLNFEIKPYNTKQLCAFYGISRYIFNKWVFEFKEELGPQIGRLWTIQQIKTIIKHLDKPE